MATALPLATEPALERLSQMTSLYMKQTSTGYNGSNFSVFGEDDHLLFNLNEIVPDTFFRGGARRAFQFNGVDTNGKQLFTFGRPKGVRMKDKVKLFMDDELLSVIRLARTFMTPIFNINDALDNPVIRLKGKISIELTTFKLQTNEKVDIGSIEKKFRGWKKEMSSQKDDYVINFPADLAVTYKLAVIVSCVFIDFRFFEGK
ncbi:hypothetical protein PYW07_006806 [Mythimna separata]|uniref:Phospholipid scramblase n=1 Tax=Mythimna separata TaxID=271217 RepID=A0AAD7Z1W3_MYTSE|nr:hypothetical protein PYW07_006806 [Mythimna separata]